ncbi:hypothetical protein ACWIE6_15795 [Paenibacillus taichungensis]
MDAWHVGSAAADRMAHLSVVGTSNDRGSIYTAMFGLARRSRCDYD